MSPSWRNRLLVGLAPDQVSIVRCTRGWRPKCVSERLEVAPGEHSPWQSATDALAQLLRTLEPVAWGVHISLSNHFVHYAVIPAARSLPTAAERQALAAIVFEQRYGALARDWSIQLSPARKGQSTVGSGIPKPLLKRLQTVCSESPARLRLRSIRPLLMGTFNQIRRRINGGNHGLAIVETGRITLARCHGGQWQSVTSRAVDPDDENALSRLVTEDSAFQGAVSSGMLWLDDLTGHVALRPGSAWASQPVSGVALPGISDCLALRGLS